MRSQWSLNWGVAYQLAAAGGSLLAALPLDLVLINLSVPGNQQLQQQHVAHLMAQLVDARLAEVSATADLAASNLKQS